MQGDFRHKPFASAHQTIFLMTEANKSIQRWSATTVVISALLLFQVQPMASKAILAWFGGASSVWTTSMLFFQTILVAGYCYAHLLSRWPIHRQFRIHCILVLSACIFLPLSFSAPEASAASTQPVSTILFLLFVTVGLPYFVLSTTGPLVQNWFGLTQGQSTPYRLYSLSNIGSLTALITYPFLMEVYLDIPTQGGVWSVGYVCFALAISILGWRCTKQGLAHETENDKPQPTVEGPPTTKQMGKWAALAALASILLLAVTDQLTQDIAVIPFLWIMPLAIYLISFVITFDNPKWYFRRSYALGTAAAILLLSLYYIRETVDGYLGFLLFQGIAENVVAYTILMALAFFFACMTCHGELFRIRPDKQHLTLYYLCISIGGALGGFLVSVICPVVFSQYHEYHLGLIAAFSLAGLVLVKQVLDKNGLLQLSVVIPVGLAFGLVVLSQWKMTQHRAEIATRNFYGTLQVSRTTNHLESTDNHLQLRHGRVVHGTQIIDDSAALKPTTYYGRKSGIGQVFGLLDEKVDLEITAVGLGTGTLSVYARQGDKIRFYEINPKVIELARTSFRYLTLCSTDVETIAADGRMGIQSQPTQSIDLLILDAFSSDAIPVHLLTLEAFELYLNRLNTNGVICVHISNQHLDLVPVLNGIAQHHQLSLRIIDSKETVDTYDARWAILSKAPEFISKLDQQSTATKPENIKQISPWTDHYSNLLQILK